MKENNKNTNNNYNYYELEPENNHFYSIVVDITHRCNMECKNCYIPNRNIPDMDINKLIDCLKKIPGRKEIRLVGAEPTLRKDIQQIISEIRKIGHRPVMMTNGLKLANKEYAKSLYNSGLKTINISLNGADDDDIYKITDNGSYAKRKIKALENCANIGYFINTNTVMIRGVNDNVPSKLISIIKNLNINAVMRFRNIGQLGRYHINSNGNWTFEELLDHISKITNIDINIIKSFNKVNGYEEERTVLFPLEENKIQKTSWIKITDWAPLDSNIPDPNNKRRGRITENFKIAPFFEHVKLNEFGY